MEFWKKENGDRFKINSPILSQRYGLKLSHHPYLTHMNGLVFCCQRSEEEEAQNPAKENTHRHMTEINIGMRILVPTI